MRRLLVFCLTCLSVTSLAATPAQTPTPTQPPAPSDLRIYDDPVPPPHFLDIFTNLPDDLVEWWKATFNRENAPELASVLASTAVLIPVDYQTWQAVYRPTQEHPNMREFFHEGEQAAAGEFQLAMPLMFLGWGATGNHRALRTAYEIGEGVLSSGIVVQLMKRATGRESPKGSLSKGGKWQGYPGEKAYLGDLRDHDAMPSGHMSSSFVVFEIIRRNYPEVKWIPWVGYPAMAVMAVSCVGANIHWFSDFPIAFALGYSFARIVTDRNYRGHADIAKADTIGTKWNDPLFTIGQSSGTGDPMLEANWRF